MILADFAPSSNFLWQAVALVLAIAGIVGGFGGFGLYLLEKRKGHTTTISPQPIKVEKADDCVQREEYERRQEGEKSKRDQIQTDMKSLQEDVTRIDTEAKNAKEQFEKMEKRFDHMTDRFTEFLEAFAEFRGEVKEAIKKS